MKPSFIEMEKDIQLLKTIAKTGFITEKFLTLLGITHARLKQHICIGNIEKKATCLVYGIATNIYTLTTSSKKRMQSEFGINLYKGDVSQIEHDYVLLKVYLQLSPSERESWETESSLKIDYPSAKKTTDGMFVRDTKKIAVEIITDSYSKEEIEAKKDFIRYYCDDYIMLHTYKDINYKL